MTAAEPLQYFVERGIKPPYKRWGRFIHKKVSRRREDGSFEFLASQTERNTEDVIEYLYYIIDFMNRQDEAFDGFATFS